MLLKHLPGIQPRYHKADTSQYRVCGPDHRTSHLVMMETENLVDSISLACVKDKEWPEFSRYKPEKSLVGGRTSNSTGNSGNRSPISASGHNGSGKFIE